MMEFADYPGVLIGFESRTSDRPANPEDKLITRVLRTDKRGLPDRLPKTTLRQTDQRRIAGLNAEELVRKYKLPEGLAMLGWAEHDAQPSRPDQPEIKLGLELEPLDDRTQKPHLNLPSEGAVLALWDAILNSVRPRPGAL